MPKRSSSVKFGVKRLFISAVLVSLGILIGLMVASDLGWIPFTTAKNPSPSITGVSLPLLSQAGDGSQALVEVAKSVTPAVVNISTSRVIKGQEGAPLTPFSEDPFFRRFFGDEFFRQFEVPRERKEQSLGSGVIVEANGYIVTNNHVVSKADEIKVLLNDKREFKGKIVGTDPKTDLAVIKIDAANLPTIPWGDSLNLQVGELVLAVGNPFGLNQTVTMGIISAVGRANVGVADYEDFIQTDAAINPGNSGGALVNIRGELIGINTAIFTRSGGYMGIGFAVPSNMAKSVMESLKTKGKVVRGWLGVTIQEVNADLAKQFGLKETKGALVSDVLEGSPAEKAGVERGDVIVELNGKPVESATQLKNMVAQLTVGNKVDLSVIREKKEKRLTVLIAEQPKEITVGSTEEDQEGSKAMAGIEVNDLTAEMARRFGLPRDQKGVVVTQVEAGSNADLAGIRRGDLIIEINRHPVSNTDDYEQIISKLKKQESVLLLVSRQGRTLFITIAPE
jgi:serine protease Do